MTTAIEKLLGGGKKGKFFKNGKAITGGNYAFIYFQEDTVLTTFTDSKDGNQITAWDISGETIKAGTVLFAQGGLGIKALTVSSGSGFVFDEIL